MTTNYRKAKLGQALRLGSIIIIMLALCAANLFIWSTMAKAETTFTPYHTFKAWVLPAGVSTQSTPVWSEDIFPQDVYVAGNEYCAKKILIFN